MSKELDLQKLRDIASAATEGPWSVHPYDARFVIPLNGGIENYISNSSDGQP